SALVLALSLEGSDAPLSAAHLRERLTRVESVWAWVDAPRIGWVRDGDAVSIVDASSSGGLPVIEDAGLAVVAAPGDPRPVIGRVHGIFRQRRPWSLLGSPWAAAIALRSLRAWQLAELVSRMGEPVAHLADQLRPAPTPEEAEAIQSRFYGAPELVAGTRATTEGLSDVEERLAARWMRPGDRVLDVGCGTGREAIGFARRGLRVIGVDASARATEEARRLSRELSGEVGERLSFETACFRMLDLPAESFEVVFLASDVYASIPGRANRVASLERARSAVRSGGIVIVPADLAVGRVSRALFDAPRAFLRACGVKGPQPGDRWVLRGPPPTRMFRHGFSSEAEVIAELDSAGLDYLGRVSSYVVARRREARVPVTTGRASSLATELIGVIAALPRVERARRSMGPAPVVALLRAGAARTERRDPARRARLRTAIRICDRLLPFGGGCYRRSLLEMALDAGAADETLFLGLRGTDGHAWLENAAPADALEVTFAV
ncbi:MAG: class I SAM-dependent methyltransferase, partial [Polyangiaceae bacterium]